MDLEYVYDTLLEHATGQEIFDLLDARHKAREHEEGGVRC